jgi:hypothetical protein
MEFLDIIDKRLKYSALCYLQFLLLSDITSSAEKPTKTILHTLKIHTNKSAKQENSMNIILGNGKTRVENQTKLFPVEPEKTRTYAQKPRLKFRPRIPSLNGRAETLIRPADLYKRIHTP